MINENFLRIFFAFLKDNNAYNRFIINLTKRFKGDKNQAISYVRDTPMPSLIARAFFWENKKEQLDFWRNWRFWNLINSKWTKICEIIENEKN